MLHDMIYFSQLCQYSYHYGAVLVQCNHVDLVLYFCQNIFIYISQFCVILIFNNCDCMAVAVLQDISEVTDYIIIEVYILL